MSDHESTYVPKTAVERWMDTRLPIIRFGMDYANLPTPKNLNYWYTFGGILSLCLMTQIITGIILIISVVFITIVVLIISVVFPVLIIIISIIIISIIIIFDQ